MRTKEILNLIKERPHGSLSFDERHRISHTHKHQHSWFHPNSPSLYNHTTNPPPKPTQVNFIFSPQLSISYPVSSLCIIWTQIGVSGSY
ncbi:hypothetical protein QVD17_05535 [Tagetes erecta]|uniref:Uncharacterized protein n=1 Tax=Tagetes erecta TaxID=13708 RepID=A0AAD8LC57_TARER|nr:hypothetical protein QVD17_05535 [Tagetes erecta]